MIDRIGRLKLLYPSILLWSFSGIAGAFLDNLYLILVSRALLGLATAFVMSCVMTLLGDYYAKGGRLEGALGLQNCIMAFAGGLLAGLAWQYIFLVYGFGFFVLFACAYYLFESKIKRKQSSQNPSLWCINHFCKLGYELFN